MSTNKEIITEVDTYLKGFNLTPEEYLNEHKLYWLSIVKPNYMCIAYEDIVFDFEVTMYEIAKFLGSDKTEFIRETKRVGWYDKNETPKNFS